MSQRPRRKKRRTGGQTRPKRGVMIGMRSGFQKAANKVVGAGQEKPGKRSSWMSTAFTVVLIAAAIAFLLYRWQ
jgi:hypothetical protein